VEYPFILFTVYLNRDRYKEHRLLHKEQSDACIIVFIAKANSQHLSLEGLLTIKKNKGIKKNKNKNDSE